MKYFDLSFFLPSCFPAFLLLGPAGSFCFFLLVRGSVIPVVDFQLTGYRHQKDTSQIGAANTAEIDMGKACQNLIFKNVGR